MTDRNTSWQR